MHHELNSIELGPYSEPMKEAIQKCVHCGFCLPTCPTYQVLGDEAESPRGRILLMKHVLEGSTNLEDAQPHIDRCLGCLACETYCPSGVPYSQLLSPFRAWSNNRTRRSKTWVRWLVMSTIPFPFRFRLAMRMGRIVKRFERWSPTSLKPMLSLIPATGSIAERICPPPQNPDSLVLQPTTIPAARSSQFKGRVAILEGCAQRVLDPEIHQAAVRVLQRNGIEVIIPKGQGCCGALAWHLGYDRAAQQFAKRNMSLFPKDVDAILSTAAGCGSVMHEYPVLMGDTPQAIEAKAFAKIAKDVLTYLDQVGIEKPVGFSKPVRIAYHDACHLAHGQKEKLAPRRLLLQIPGVELVPLIDSDLCCGSAGSYNMDQPAIAAKLGTKKAKSIIDTRCDVVALANIGCEVQIREHLRQLGSDVPVFHVVQILEAAYAQREISRLEPD